MPDVGSRIQANLCPHGRVGLSPHWALSQPVSAGVRKDREETDLPDLRCWPGKGRARLNRTMMERIDFYHAELSVSYSGLGREVISKSVLCKRDRGFHALFSRKSHTMTFGKTLSCGFILS